ncbi:peptidoglycan DD-metalloendopeptidase family protein [Pseudomaricurvus sp. HS19]|nr:peptidoglycan DD-metalloendopeptidase family protein [Pseudomaricurvus sp. HS19]
MRVSGLLLCALLTLPLLAQAAGDDDYQAKINQLQQSIKQLQQELQKAKGSRDQLQSDLQSSEVDISETLKKIEQLKGELASQKKQLTQLNRKQDELQAASSEQQRYIAQDINAAYRLGSQSQLKLLLNQQQPETVARMNKYYSYFLNARSSRVDAYLETIAELNIVRPQIEARTRALEENSRQLQQRRQQLLARQKERTETLARLNASISRKDEELKQQSQDKQRLEKLLEEVTAAIANLALPTDGEPFAKLRGRMPFPAKGRLLNRFGSSRLEGKLRWEGVMIGAREGTPVHAIHHGRVVFSDYLRGHGMLVIIDHGDGYMSLYAHNQSLLRETGDWVSSGEVIAKVGNTGGQSQSALYFEIRHNGKPTNPARWCKA